MLPTRRPASHNLENSTRGWLIKLLGSVFAQQECIITTVLKMVQSAIRKGVLVLGKSYSTIDVSWSCNAIICIST